ncbi:RlpA-like double-psi beta-barrel-protein domain-containing protein-containing protein [Russula brevipes]|nr:RlpA-like double-psi beta-barrel-protein domain-containing protein-containing protein [Russula brevipes]
MKSALTLALALVLAFFSTLAAAKHSGRNAHKHQFHCGFQKSTTTTNMLKRNGDGWLQRPKGYASFTAYSSCQNSSCGYNMTSGYTAAINELAFGGNDGAGDACGRCFKITPAYNPYVPKNTDVGTSIVVMATNLCPRQNSPDPRNPNWCNQTVSHPHNVCDMPMQKNNRSFDLCIDSGASKAFFPSDEVGAMLGIYEEVSCSQWSGSIGKSLWGHACLEGKDAAFWPAGRGCGNRGANASLARFGFD